MSIIIASFISLIYIMALNTRPFLTVSQVVNNAETYDKREIQLSGIVTELFGNEFQLTEGDEKIKVIPVNIKIPADVKNGSEVVVQGEFDSSKILLEVNEILTYCCDRA